MEARRYSNERKRIFKQTSTDTVYIPDDPCIAKKLTGALHGSHGSC
jgi:hypothetical protein